MGSLPLNAVPAKEMGNNDRILEPVVAGSLKRRKLRPVLQGVHLPYRTRLVKRLQQKSGQFKP